MLGRLFSWAIVERRDPLMTEKALEEPPSMVGIEEVIMHFMPLQKYQILGFPEVIVGDT